MRPIWILTLLNGQCRSLSAGQTDPCLARTWCQTMTQGKDYCMRTEADGGSGKKGLTAVCVPWGEPNGLCRPVCASERVCRDPCSDGSVCVNSVRVRWPGDAYPSSLKAADNVFWANPGPDLLTDMAGMTRLDNNYLLSCVQSSYSPDCRPRAAFRRSVRLKWEKTDLPAGASIVWQNPSTYPQKEYESSLGGNDLFRTFAGRSLLWRPTLCQALATQ